MTRVTHTVTPYFVGVTPITIAGIGLYAFSDTCDTYIIYKYNYLLIYICIYIPLYREVCVICVTGVTIPSITLAGIGFLGVTP